MKNGSSRLSTVVTQGVALVIAGMISAVGPVRPAPADEKAAELDAYLQMREDVQPYQAFLEKIEKALLAGDQSTLKGVLSLHRTGQLSPAAVQSFLSEYVMPFFAQGEDIGREVWVFPSSDQFGSRGFAFYKRLVVEDGTSKPYAAYIVRENGTLVVSNLVVNKSYEDLHHDQHPWDAGK